MKQLQQEKVDVQEEINVQEEAVYSNYNISDAPVVDNTIVSNENTDSVKPDEEEEIVDTGLKAVALYDYQAAAEDEISFDPDDPITHIEMVIT